MKTYENFIKDLFQKKTKLLDEPGKFFKEGDIVRRRSDGRIGRIDLAALSVESQIGGEQPNGYYIVYFGEDEENKIPFIYYYKKDLDKLETQDKNLIGSYMSDIEFEIRSSGEDWDDIVKYNL